MSIVCRTGQLCPRTGVWQRVGFSPVKLVLDEAEPMPRDPHGAGTGLWVYVGPW